MGGAAGPPFHTTPRIWLNQSLHGGNASTHTILTWVKIGARGKLRKKLNFVATHTIAADGGQEMFLLYHSPPVPAIDSFSYTCLSSIVSIDQSGGCQDSKLLCGGSTPIMPPYLQWLKAKIS